MELESRDWYGGPIVPAWLLRRTDLTPGDKLVLAFVADRARLFESSDDVFRMARQTIADELGMPLRNLERIVDGLVERGLVARKARPGKPSVLRVDLAPPSQPIVVRAAGQEPRVLGLTPAAGGGGMVSTSEDTPAAGGGPPPPQVAEVPPPQVADNTTERTSRRGRVLDPAFESIRIREACRLAHAIAPLSVPPGLPFPTQLRDTALAELAVPFEGAALAGEIARVARAKHERLGSPARWDWILEGLGHEQPPRLDPSGDFDAEAYRLELDDIAGAPTAAPCGPIGIVRDGGAAEGGDRPAQADSP